MHDTKNNDRSACHCLSGWRWIQGGASRISKKQSITLHRGQSAENSVFSSLK